MLKAHYCIKLKVLFPPQKNLMYPPLLVLACSSEVAPGRGDVEVCDDIPEDLQPSPEEEEQLQKRRGELRRIGILTDTRVFTSRSLRLSLSHLCCCPADVLLRAEAVFSDVHEDFSDVKKILARFEDWRGAYSDSYQNAYISLCLPKLLSPLIRHQMLAWDPLKVHSRTHHTHACTH